MSFGGTLGHFGTLFDVGGDMIKLAEADALSAELEELLAPYCHRFQVAGSVRRRRDKVRDIDFVAIPIWFTLKPKILGIADRVLRSGPKWASFIFKGVQVDIYYATEETWATLLLIKTGSKESNIRLCSLARNRGWHLAASGDGLFDEHDERIAGDTEESIFEALGEKYLEPWQRDLLGR